MQFHCKSGIKIVKGCSYVNHRGVDTVEIVWGSILPNTHNRYTHQKLPNFFPWHPILIHSLLHCHSRVIRALSPVYESSISPLSSLCLVVRFTPCRAAHTLVWVPGCCECSLSRSFYDVSVDLCFVKTDLIFTKVCIKKGYSCRDQHTGCLYTCFGVRGAF